MALILFFLRYLCQSYLSDNLQFSFVSSSKPKDASISTFLADLVSVKTIETKLAK